MSWFSNFLDAVVGDRRAEYVMDTATRYYAEKWFPGASQPYYNQNDPQASQDNRTRTEGATQGRTQGTTPAGFSLSTNTIILGAALLAIGGVSIALMTRKK